MTKHCLCINGPLKGETVAVSDEMEFFRATLPVPIHFMPFCGIPQDAAGAVDYRVAKWRTSQGQQVWLAYCGARPTANEVFLALGAR